MIEWCLHIGVIYIYKIDSWPVIPATVPAKVRESSIFSVPVLTANLTVAPKSEPMSSVAPEFTVSFLPAKSSMYCEITCGLKRPESTPMYAISVPVPSCALGWISFSSLAVT